MVKIVSAKELKKDRSWGQDELAEINERLSRIEKILTSLLEKVEALEEQMRKEGEKNTSKTPPGRVKTTAVEIIKRQGIVFESDLTTIRNRDRFFEHLAKNGVIVFEGNKERAAVTKEFLDQFMKAIERFSPSEAEEKLTGNFKRLYSFLRESGLLVYDNKNGWNVLLKK